MMLVQALSGVLHSRGLELLLVCSLELCGGKFCSSRAVTLGLFDYLADLFQFDDGKIAR